MRLFGEPTRGRSKTLLFCKRRQILVELPSETENCGRPSSYLPDRKNIRKELGKYRMQGSEEAGVKMIDVELDRVEQAVINETRKPEKEKLFYG